MNSKQINFYITPQDISNIYDFLKEKRCILLKNNVENVENRVLDNELSKVDTFQIFISNEKYQKQIEYKYLDSKKYYYLDVLKSFVIEFDFGGFYPYSDKELHRSRFYYVVKYYGNDGQIITKDKEFINWADDIFKNFKKRFLIKSTDYSGVFFSKNSLDWINANEAKKTTDGQKFIIK